MADFPKLMTAFLMIVIFSFLTIGFAIQVGDTYDKDTTELEDAIGSSSITSTLDTFNRSAEAWKESFYGEQKNIFSTVAGIVVNGIFGIVLNMGTFIIAPFVIFSSILTNVLKVPIQIVYVLNIAIIFTIIFGIWRLIKAGH